MYIKILKCEFDFLYVFESYFFLYKFWGKVKFIFILFRIVIVVYLWYFFIICLVIVIFRYVFNNKIINYYEMREFLLYYLFYIFIEFIFIWIKRIFFFIKKVVVCYRIVFCFIFFNIEKLIVMKFLVFLLVILIWVC